MSTEKILTRELIEQETGFKAAVIFPRWQSDGAALASYHDEHERLVSELGWENVFGSLSVDEGALVLGIFVRKIQGQDRRQE